MECLKCGCKEFTDKWIYGPLNSSKEFKFCDSCGAKAPSEDKKTEHPNKEVAAVCVECGSDLKWLVTCYRCRNLNCRAEYPHNAEP